MVLDFAMDIRSYGKSPMICSFLSIPPTVFSNLIEFSRIIIFILTGAKKYFYLSECENKTFILFSIIFLTHNCLLNTPGGN